MNDLPANNLYVGKEARRYDLGRITNPVTLEDDAAIVRFLDTCWPGYRLADVPCGTGRALTPVIERGLEYWGADTSQDMLALCGKKIPRGMHAELVQANALSLPWPSDSFEALLSFKFLKWLPRDEDVHTALREFRRICHGRALINVKIRPEDASVNMRELWDRAKKRFNYIKYGVAARCLDRSNFESMLLASGWRIDVVDINAASNGIVHNYVLR